MANTAKVFVRTFRKMSLQKIKKLLVLTLPHPLFTLLSFYATVRSFIIAKKYFPQTNSGHGIGNAFRHALWTCLIMMYCCKISSARKANAWCKIFTDMHEVIFPNEPIETFMDLHNNQVGIDLFNEMLRGIHRQFFETSFIVDRLFAKTRTAVGVNSEEEARKGELVFLINNPNDDEISVIP